jgi:cephalosporin hydroxylase
MEEKREKISNRRNPRNPTDVGMKTVKAVTASSRQRDWKVTFSILLMKLVTQKCMYVLDADHHSDRADPINFRRW